MIPLPDFLSHYYEANDDPFRNLSDLPEVEAQAVLQRIRLAGDRFASQRQHDYLSLRRELEERVRGCSSQKAASQDGSGLTIWSSVHVPG